MRARARAVAVAWLQRGGGGGRTECQRSLRSNVNAQRESAPARRYSLMNFFMTMKAPSLPSCSFLKYRNHGSLVSGETMRTSNGPTCSIVEMAFALAALALFCCIDLM